MVISNLFRECKDCGKDISNLQPQCKRCAKCQKIYRKNRSHNKKYLREKKNKRKYGDSEVFTKLGTTDFKSHRRKNFQKEMEEIEEEMKRLRLR